MERANGGMRLALGCASQRCAGETGGSGGREGRRKRPVAKPSAPCIEGRMFGHMQLPGDGVTRRS